MSNYGIVEMKREKNHFGSVPESVGTTRIAIRQNEYLRGYTYDFIELFAPHLTREVVAKAMHSTIG